MRTGAGRPRRRRQRGRRGRGSIRVAAPGATHRSAGRIGRVGRLRRRQLQADVVVRAPRRPGRGETVIGSSCDTYLGGKGFNQAVAAARAGATTSMVGALGDDDYGHGVRPHARPRAHRRVRRAAASPAPAPGSPSPSSRTRARTRSSSCPRRTTLLTVADIDRLGSVIGRAAVVLLQLELPADVVVAAAAAAHSAEPPSCSTRHRRSPLLRTSPGSSTSSSPTSPSWRCSALTARPTCRPPQRSSVRPPARAASW